LDVGGQGSGHRREYIPGIEGAGIEGTKVVMTPRAAAVVGRVSERRGGSLALVIGNGCCDATAPFLFADYMPGPTERLVCEAEGLPIFVDESIAASFEGREVVIDASDDPQPDSFSLESEFGLRLRLERLPILSQ
jgi:uncharacterized protein (DUF779 family)